MTFRCPAKREDRRIASADTRVGESNADEPLRPRRFERGKRFELVDRVLPSAHLFIQPRQFLASGSERRVDLERAAKCSYRLPPIVLAETEGEQVVGFSESIVERNRAAKRVHGTCGLAVAIVGHGQLVEDARRTVVKPEVTLVFRRGRRVLTERGLHVAEQLDRPGRGRVEKRCLTKVAERSGVVATPAIRVASFQGREHRIRLEGECSAEGLDSLEGLTGGDGGVANGDQPSKLALPSGIHPDQHRRCHDGHGGDGKDDGAPHIASDGNTQGSSQGFAEGFAQGSSQGLAHEGFAQGFARGWPEGTYRRRWGLMGSRTVLNFMQTPISGGLVKNAGAVAWSEVDTQEAALIARCNTGDEAACADLVSIHQRMVYSLALHLLGDRDEALDLSQEVFLRVFRTLSSFRGQSALRTWIYRIVINQARNRQRWWRRRHRSSQVSLDDHLQQFGDVESKTDVLPDRQLASKETSVRIWQALDRLPFDQRTALILREVDGLRYDEIAFSLGVAVGTVKSRLTRARQTLRAELLGLRT